MCHVSWKKWTTELVQQNQRGVKDTRSVSSYANASSEQDVPWESWKKWPSRISVTSRTQRILLARLPFDWSYWLAASPRSSWTARGSRNPPWPRGACRRTLGRWGSRTAQVAHWRTPSSGRSTSRRPQPDSSLCTGPLAPERPSAPSLCGRQY